MLFDLTVQNVFVWFVILLIAGFAFNLGAWLVTQAVRILMTRRQQPKQ